MQLISIKTCNTLPETNIKWSPDELIGIDLNLNLITKELEVLKQLETRVKNSFVDVGWGSEVTQFKGASNEISEIPIISDSGPITTEKITWRADAENFAILSRNVIYIYTRDGDLIHSSAPIHSSCISWNGQTHIASAFKNKVSFIEKCGLIHGGFGVPDDIINISCNEDGNVIAVSTATRIHFYTCSNYHWFISNTIEMEMTTRLEWSDLNVLFCQNQNSTMKVHFDLCDHVQQGLDSLLCVVDGKKLLVTPLNIVKIPLPMSKSVINCSDYIVHVSITDLICVLTTNSFELYENEKLIGKYAVKGRQIWCTRDTIVVLGSDSDTDVLQVYKWKLIDDEFCLELDSVIETNGVSLGIVDMFSNSVLIQDLNGTIFKVLNKLDKIHQFPQKCCKIMATTVDGTRIMFGKSRSKLYNESLITDDCTSFAVSPKHLIYTTLSHETIFTDPLLLSKTSRRNERGAKILVLNTRIIIYKMPRGNFETIYPRPFIQTFITSLMDRKMYREAFIECRKHRVSFDHIVSESLVSDLPKFVECIESSEYLNLFLSSITLFKNEILEKVRDLVIDKNDMITTVLTTFILVSPRRLSDALKLTIKIKQSGNLTLLKKTIKYMMFLIDSNELYNVALGMYEFDLCISLCQESQKDPREYLEFFESLLKLDVNRQKFHVDEILKRFEIALDSLILYASFDEILFFIKKHSIWDYAIKSLKLYERYFDFCEIYADVLYDSGKFYHAGVLFNRTSNNKSIKSFQKAGLYRECLTAAMRFSPDTINQVSLDVISDLKSVGKFKEASIVAIDYLKDYKNAVNLLVQGGHLIDAIRITTNNSLDLNEIKASSLKLYETLNKDLNEINVLFTNHSTRLIYLKQAKIENPEMYNVTANLDDIDIMSDTSSMKTRTTNSLFSYNSQRTSKSRRKLLRKKGSSRQGGIFELDYLATQIREIVKRFNGFVAIVDQVIFVLDGFLFFEEAVLIKKLVVEMSAFMEVGLEESFKDLVLTSVASDGNVVMVAACAEVVVSKLPDTLKFI